MSACGKCRESCSNPIALKCEHLFCASCDSSIELKTVELERGKECPLCSTFSPKNFITQEFRHFDLPTAVPNSKVWPNSLMKICKLPLEETKRTVLEFELRGLSIFLVLGELWISCKDQAYFLIYSQDGFFVRKQAFDEGALSHPNTVAALSSTEVAITCANSGLWILNTEGKKGKRTLKNIDQGKFIDFCVYNNKIYCLEDETRKIYVYCICKETWKKSAQEILLDDYQKICKFDTISVYQNYLYVGSWHENCIFRYTLNGTKEAKFGVRGKGEAGNLVRPRIVAKDQMGSLLICDAMNGRLQVLNPDNPKKWHMTRLTTLQFPHSVVPTGNGEGLWVLQNRERDLTFYTLR